MASTAEIEQIIRACVRHNGKPRISFIAFEQFLVKFANRFSNERPSLRVLLGPRRSEIVTEALDQLEHDDIVKITRTQSGDPTEIYVNGYFRSIVEKWYAQMKIDKSRNFLAETGLKVTIPSKSVIEVEVTNNLMQWLQPESTDEGQILLLRFPNGVREIVVTVGVLQHAVLDLALAKIRDYIRAERNAAFVDSRMRTVFRGREVLVSEMVETIQTRAERARETLQKPNEFQFHFWTQLSSLIIKEIAGKVEKLEPEHGFCQAAYLLGYYAVLNKGRHKEQRDAEQARRQFERRFREAPFTFSVQDALAFTDDKGTPLAKKVSRTRLTQWLEDLSARGEKGEPGTVVRIATPDDHEVIVHRDTYLPLVLKQLASARHAVLFDVAEGMYRELRHETGALWVKDQTAFEVEVSRCVRRNAPMLVALADFATLFLVADASSGVVRERGMALLDQHNQMLKSWSELLQLNRSELYDTARLKLPAWMLVPVLRGIVKLLRRMFAPKASQGKRAKQRSRDGQTASEDASRAQAARKRFEDLLGRMQQEYLSPGETPDQKLAQLRNDWNPLLDPVARENLLEDVNALCRDTLRKMKLYKRIESPNLERIEELAQTVARNDAFVRIKQRTAFETYLKLYLLTHLQRTK